MYTPRLQRCRTSQALPVSPGIRRARIASLALASGLGWPVAALACPVCFVAGEASRVAFLWTAIAMTLLPLAMVGGLVFWLWRQFGRANGNREAGQD